MPLKNYKSVTPSRRNAVGLIYNDITSKKPYKALIRPLKKTGGRNNQGKITTRHIGGGNKRQYRVIDFKRNKDNIIGNISSIEYDPNRNARICLVNYADGEKRYILAPEGIKIGDQIESGNKVKMTIGNAMELDNIANGAFIHNIELNPGQGGKICRSAGTYAQILGKEGKYVIVRLISGETRKILGSCRATVGAVGNKEFNLAKKGKAGKSRYEGIRPTVRGSAMNPVDHSHGGGEGRCPVGKDAPRTPWGRKALGVKTRNNRKRSTKLIIMRRMRKMRKR